MTPEELETMLSAAANPDSAPAALEMLREKCKNLMSDKSNADAAAAEKDATINSLRATNAFLLSRAGTSSQNPDVDDEKEISDMSRKELDNYFMSKIEEAKNNGKS